MADSTATSLAPPSPASSASFPPPLTPASPRPPPTSTEITGARTADSSLFDNHNGTYSAYFAKNMNYLASPGNYQPKDLHFHPAPPSLPGVSYVENHSAVTVTVSPSGVDSHDSSGAGLRLLTTGPPSVSGTAASTLINGVTWLIQATGAGMEASTVVTSPQGPKTYSLSYTLLGGASRFSVDSQGNLVSNHFHLGRPIVIGSNGSPYQTGTWSLSGANTAQFSFDDSALPASAYPYVIDPPLVYDQGATLGESFLLEGSPYPPSGFATGYDGSSWLLADDSNEGSGKYGVSDLALNFNTTSIPASAAVQDISLAIWSCLSTQNASDGAEDLMLDFPNGSPMSPSGMYPPNAYSQILSPVGNLGGSSAPVSCIYGQAATQAEDFWDVGINGINQGGTTTARLHVMNRTTWPSSPAPNGSNFVYFAGYANPANYPPILGVTYALPAPAPTQVSPIGTQVVSLTPSLVIQSETDPDGDSPVYYAYAVSSDSSGRSLVWYTPRWLASTTSVTVPAGTLSWNQTYWWWACAWDNHDNTSRCSPMASFTTPPQAPAVPVPTNPAPGAFVTSTVQFSVQPVSDPNGGSITYQFQVWSNPNGTGQPVADSGRIATPSYSLNGLSDGTTYYWRVESWASEGPTPSGWTTLSQEYFTVDATPPPAPVVTPTMVPWSSSSSAPYSWTDSDSRVAGYAYNFVAGSANDPGTTSMGAATSVTETASSVGTWYFSIRAINQAGVPGPTATATYVMGAASPPPTGGPIGPLEQLGGCTCGYSTQDRLGQNVDTATGDYWRSYTDLSIPGRGPGLNLTRTYNSLLGGTAGPLGNGWTSDYLMSLTVGATTTVVNQETGSQAAFTASGGGWAPAEPRVLATLVNNNGTWTFTRRGTQIFTFNSNGWLTSISDPNGNATTLSYNGSTITITDGAGRTLTVTLSGSFGAAGVHVVSVADQTGRTVTYHYDAGNNLIEVDDIGGGVTLFGYDTAHNLTSIKEPDQVPTSNATPGIVPTLPQGGQPWANSYDGQHRVTATVDFKGATTSFNYAAGTTMTSITITDPMNNVTLESYQYGELMSKITGYGSAAPSIWTYTYDPNTVGVTSVHDPKQNMSSTVYDALGNKRHVTDQLGRTTYYDLFNGFGEPGAIGDPNGVTTTYFYDPVHGNVTETSTPLTSSPGTYQVVRFFYTDASHPGDLTNVIDPDGHGVTYTYDSYGDVKQAVDDLGDTTKYGYNTSNGQRTSMTSPRQYTTSYTYDAFGDLVTQTDPNGHTMTNTYTSDRNLVSSVDANNNATTYIYDADNQRVRTNLPDGAFLQDSYDGDHNHTVHQEQNGHGVDYSYADPAFPNKLTEADPLNGNPAETTVYSYDPDGNLATQATSRVAGCGCTTNYGYDTGSELTSILYPSGTPNVTSIQYDADGQRTTMTVVGQATATWAYDSLHRVTATRDGNNSTVGYGYDLDGNVTAIAYPGSGTVGRAYDQVGRLVTVTDTVGAATQYRYDADSNLIAQAYPNATTASIGYDNADQLSWVTDTSTSAPTAPGFMSFSYTRSAAGQITQTASTGVVGTSVTTFNYTAAQQLDQTNKLVNQPYDPGNNPVLLQSQAVQTYNGGDELTTSSQVRRVGTATATDAGSSPTLTLALPVSATVNDQVIVSVVLQGSGSVSTPAGYSVVSSTATGSANSDARLVVLRHTVASGDSSTLTLSATASSPKVATAVAYRGVSSTSPIDAVAVGSAASNTQVTTPSINVSGAGDQLVALAGADVGTSATWSVSSPPTMTVRASPSAPWIATAAWDGLQIAGGSVPGMAATASASGNLVGALLALVPARTAYTYDSQGNLLGSSAPGVTTTMGYDAANRLVSSVSQTATSQVTATYGYFGDGRRASKTTAGGTTHYTWDQVDGTLLSDGTTAYVSGLGGVVLEQIGASGSLYYHQDQLGSTRALTNATGTVVAAFTYDDNGNLTMATGTVSTPFGFAGQYRDAESGLIYMGARYYNPATAQFLTRDPAYAESGSAYGYAGNDPIDNLDPFGLGACLFGHRGGANSGCIGASALRTTLLVIAITVAVAATTVAVVASGGAFLAAIVPAEEVTIGLVGVDAVASVGGLSFAATTLTGGSFVASLASAAANCAHARDANCLASIASFAGGLSAGALSIAATAAGSFGVAAAAAVEGGLFAFAGLLNFDGTLQSAPSASPYRGPAALSPLGPSAPQSLTSPCLT